jgi:hypothetical protein
MGIALKSADQSPRNDESLGQIQAILALHAKLEWVKLLPVPKTTMSKRENMGGCLASTPVRQI